jgi:hypothetical protein
VRARAAAALLALAASAALAGHPVDVVNGVFGAKNSKTIAIFAEGWTQADIDAGKFKAAAAKAVAGLFAIPPYDVFKNHIRVIAVGTPSQNHGCRRIPCQKCWILDKDDKPVRETGTEFDKNRTFFSLSLKPKFAGGVFIHSINTFEMSDEGLDAYKKVLKEVECDYAIIMAPADDLAPEGIHLEKGKEKMPISTVVMTDGGSLGATAAHELGHAMFGLADEYASPRNSCGNQHSVLPFPNASHFRDKRVPWAHLLPCIGDPQYSGPCDGTFRPTNDCIMIQSVLDKQGDKARFCDACLGHMTGKVTELGSLIRGTEPGGPIVTGEPGGSWFFKVHTRGTADSDYTGNWTIDGKSMGEGTKTATPNGPRFELAFSVKLGVIDLGLHTVRFSVVNNQTPTNKKCEKIVGKTPSTKTWRMVSTGFKLGIPGLESKESWD